MSGDVDALIAKLEGATEGRYQKLHKDALKRRFLVPRLAAQRRHAKVRAAILRSREAGDHGR